MVKSDLLEACLSSSKSRDHLVHPLVHSLVYTSNSSLGKITIEENVLEDVLENLKNKTVLFHSFS